MQGQHVYHVGDDGLLVHKGNIKRCGKLWGDYLKYKRARGNGAKWGWQRYASTMRSRKVNKLPKQFAHLKKFRSKNNMPPWSGERGIDGVAAKLEINGRVFYGKNTWTSSDAAARSAFKKIGFKNPRTGKTPFGPVAHHAEGQVFLKAAKAKVGKNSRGALYIDAKISGFCENGGVKALGNGLGLKRLDVHELLPDGSVRVSTFKY